MHIHLDLVGGLAGDMFLAAAIDAGLVDVDALTATLRTLGLGPVRIETQHAVRGAIAGTHVAFAGWDPAHDADHRHLSTIEKMLAESGLSDGVKATATRLFRLLGAAEAKIHGIELERVHFHEVGAVDSILDFVSAAWIIERAGATWSCSAIPAGRGSIITAHGEIPVPAPAAAELMRGMPIQPRDVQAELVTPTGAAILAGITPQFRARGGVLTGSGYGLGTRDLPEVSNVVRMLVFEDTAAGYTTDRVVRLEAEVDDQTPEQLAAARDTLTRAGAVDVTFTPVSMKKGRLGTRVTVLGPLDTRDSLLTAMFRATTTFGVRIDEVSRATLRREVVTVTTEYGEVRVKFGWLGDEVVRRTPEYEDCAAAALRHSVDLGVVFAAALLAADPL